MRLYILDAKSTNRLRSIDFEYGKLSLDMIYDVLDCEYIESVRVDTKFGPIDYYCDEEGKINGRHKNVSVVMYNSNMVPRSYTVGNVCFFQADDEGHETEINALQKNWLENHICGGMLMYSVDEYGNAI